MFYVYVLASIQKEINHKNMLVIYRNSKNKMSTEKFQVKASKKKKAKFKFIELIFTCVSISVIHQMLSSVHALNSNHYHLIKMLGTLSLKAIKTTTLLPVKRAKQKNSTKKKLEIKIV